MAQIIDIRKAQEARRTLRQAHQERASLEAAIDRMKASLADTVRRLQEAPPPEQHELVERIAKLAELIRYGLRMLYGALPPKESPRKTR